MASSVTIDVDSDQNKKDGLEFQDIPHDTWGPMETEEQLKGKSQTHTFTNFPHSAADSEDDESDKTELLKEKKSASFWTFEYYQQFFDVETNQVVGRILYSMIPRPGRNYLESHIRPNPDLYGPFWICTTLVFTTAIAGNLANYIQAAGKDYNWSYDFHKVTLSATAIFSYWWVIPFALLGVLWWRGNPARYTFLEIICIYGYSLAIYIPISLLWVIQVGWLQWLLVVLGAVLSGSVLLLTFWPAVKEDSKQVAGIVMALIFIFHAALAMGFMLYFFHVPAITTAASTIAPHNTTVAGLPLRNPDNSQLQGLGSQGNAVPQLQHPSGDSNQGSKPTTRLQKSPDSQPQQLQPSGSQTGKGTSTGQDTGSEKQPVAPQEKTGSKTGGNSGVQGPAPNKRETVLDKTQARNSERLFQKRLQKRADRQLTVS